MPDGPTPQDLWVTHSAFGVPKEALKGGGGVRVAEVEFHIGPYRLAKTDLGYFWGEGSVGYSGTYAPDGAGDAGVALKFKNGQPECEKAIEKKLAGGLTLSGKGSLSATEGSVGVGLNLPDSNEAHYSGRFAEKVQWGTDGSGAGGRIAHRGRNSERIHPLRQH